MAPRVKNKKRGKQTKSSTQLGDNDYGRPPGTATTMAGPPPGTMPVLNTCRRSPHHQNDAGMTTLVQHANTHQVDPNPPRFEIIKSDDQSDDPTTSSEEAESVESPPAEATPTTL
jgi:hypothetical protein